MLEAHKIIFCDKSTMIRNAKKEVFRRHLIKISKVCTLPNRTFCICIEKPGSKSNRRWPWEKQWNISIEKIFILNVFGSGSRTGNPLRGCEIKTEVARGSS